MKQISVTIPDILFEASQDYYKGYGYRNLQEFVLDLLRKKVVLENAGRYKEIEGRMKRGIRVKRFNQSQSLRYIRGL